MHSSFNASRAGRRCGRAALAVAAYLLPAVPLAAADFVQPNVVFLVSDDHQASALGCMGNAEIETPRLDGLAARGVLFDRCYATSAICMASRATVLTGMYEFKTGCNFLTGPFRADDWADSYAVRLREAGYRIGFAGKWGMPSKGFDQAEGFDAWGGFAGSGQGSYRTAKNPSLRPYAKESPHVTRALGAFGRDFIAAVEDDDRPFCLSLSFKAPHKPHDDIDRADAVRYAGTVFPEPPGYGPAGAALLPLQPKLGRHYLQRDEWAPDRYQSHLRAYYQLISGVDTAVGMVLDALERHGVADNTLVIYTSDNGYHCGAHGLQGKVLPYETGARIPLIVFDPRLPESARGRRSGAVVGNIDFAPTILAAAGLDPPGRADGVDLGPLLTGEADRVRDSLGLIQAWDVRDRDMTKALAVAGEDWKYIRWCYADENVPPAEELYARSDVGELENRIDDPDAAGVLSDL
ncbi:MAG: sulfatase-like hydrolase/transferase, partial [Planctomycetota bacterium]